MESPPESSRLRYWFAAALAFGSLGILAGWPLDSIWVTVAVPLVAMVGYLTASWIRDRDGLATLQFADSVYYLGFLFTLVSLTVSLLAMSDQSGPYNVPGVVSRFGIALVTTVVGLGVRIYLVNFRESADDAIQRTEVALARTAELVRKTLDQISRDLTIQSRLLNEVLGATIQLAAGELKASAEEGRKAVVEVSSAMVKAVENSTDRILEAGASYAEAIEGVGRGHAKVEEEAAKLATSVVGICESSDQIRMVLDQVRGGTSTLGDFGKALDVSVKKLEKAGTEFERHTKAVAQLELQLQRDAAAVENYRRSMGQSLEQSRKNLEALSRDLVEVVAYLRKEIER